MSISSRDALTLINLEASCLTALGSAPIGAPQTINWRLLGGTLHTCVKGKKFQGPYLVCRLANLAANTANVSC